MAEVVPTTHGEMLGMSDDDFLNMAPPETGGAAAASEEEVLDPVAETEPETDTTTDPEDTGTAEPDPEDEVDPLVSDAETSTAEATEAEPTKTVEEPKETAAEVVDPIGSETEAVTSAPNYEEFYKEIMTPFKANGKMIELKDTKEAIALMQMGANYTRKMQDIQPHRKVLTMLQNNNLLDEGKLSFLIDLEKKDPEAIKKFIKDSGIDPLDIDTSVEPAYLEGSHRISDAEIKLQTALDEVSSTPTGTELIQSIDKSWDKASKDLLWEQPEVLAIMNQQKSSGIYDRITSEMDRQITLGQIPANTPFLGAYKIVGDQLAAANGFDDIIAKATPVATQTVKVDPVAVATTVAKPKATVANGSAASAASPSRSSPRTAKTFVNPLAMSDDDFLKQMENRL